MVNCKVDTSFPYMWLRGRSGKLRHLELLNLYLIGHDSDPESSILDFWNILKSTLSLETLVLDDFCFSDAFRSIRIRGRVTWRGAQIRIGVQELIDMADEWSNETSGTFEMPQIV